jgi:hypothetical protein
MRKQNPLLFSKRMGEIPAAGESILCPEAFKEMPL